MLVITRIRERFLDSSLSANSLGMTKYMTKEELKQYLESLKLEEGLKNLLFEVIDKAEVVDQVLLNNIADILDLQADFYEKSAELLEEEAGLYKLLEGKLSKLFVSPSSIKS